MRADIIHIMKWRRLILWTLLVFGLDQATKWWVVHYLQAGSMIPIIPNFFDLVHVGNRGAAFGIFAGLPDPYRFLALLLLSLVAVGVIIAYYASLPESRRGLQIPLALILGGAAGNIFDRIVRGAVVDFLSFHWYNKFADIAFFGREWHFRLEWPAFNVADTAITCSVLFLLLKLAWGDNK